MPRKAIKRFAFITGLPRSRSAWFANLLSYGDSCLLHDGFVGCQTFNDFKARLEAIPAGLVGNSDPANLLCWRSIQEAYPKAKWIVVRRDPEEAYASSVRAFGRCDTKFFNRVLQELDELERSVKPMIIGFNAFCSGMVQAAEDFLEVELGPRERIETLLRMNIQIDHKKLADGLKTIALPEFLRGALK